ncbi:MFS transporter [Magnetospirillum sp. 15-1]|uniref:MFS transporter n=1 Tax=Magnetospirillum sp. 15-1 TaxID=1979370 RepID=UPI002413790E|nr:MFS transporter [Magnetospirillum sp. 15-1]
MSLTLGLASMNRLSANYLMPFIVNELQLTNTQTGMLSSAVALTWAMSGLFLISAIGGRVTRKTLLLGLIALFSLCSVASSLSGSFLALLLARAIMGGAQGSVMPIAQSMMAANSSPGRRGLNMGLVQNVGSGILGGILAPVILVTLSDIWGWRIAIAACAAPGLVFMVLLYRSLRPGDDGKPPGGESSHDLSAGELLAYPNILLCVALSALGLMWYFLHITFLPLLLVEAFGLTPSEMGIVISLRGFSAVAAGILLPALSDRLGRKPVVVCASALGILSPLAMTIHTWPFGPLAAINLLSGFGVGVVPLVMTIIPSETVPLHRIANVIGLTVGCAELFGGFASPILAGMAADHLGILAPLWIATVGATIATLLSTHLTETNSKVSNTH